MRKTVLYTLMSLDGDADQPDQWLALRFAARFDPLVDLDAHCRTNTCSRKIRSFSASGR